MINMKKYDIYSIPCKRCGFDFNKKDLKSEAIIYKCKSCDIKFQEKPEKCYNCNESDIVKMLVYNLEKILSFNKFINIIIGARGIGKSYIAALYVIHNFEVHNESFIWAKRWKTELLHGLSIFSEEFGFGFDSKGVYKEKIVGINKKSGKEKIEKIYFGFLFTISTATNIRGFQGRNVTTILFEEYAFEAGRRLRNEMNLLDSLFETVFREKKYVKAFFISNNANRYLDLYIRAKINWNEEWNINNKWDICTHLANNVINEKTGTTMKYLRNTEYFKYAYENRALDYDERLINEVDVEFHTHEFCFYVKSLLLNLALIKYDEEFYALSICETKFHDIEVVDNYSKFEANKEINIKYMEKIIILYQENKLKYTSKYILDWIFDFVRIYSSYIYLQNQLK